MTFEIRLTDGAAQDLEDIHDYVVTFEIRLTDGAAQDLEDIHDYVSELDSPRSAAQLLDRLEAVCPGLAEFPDRGSYPRELLDLGIRDFRQVQSKPYRIIYRVIGKEVIILLIADGRRDMRSMLARRLLRP